MPHYTALIHKESDSSYGVSFPDVPGVIAAGDKLTIQFDKAGQKRVVDSFVERV
jgi:antitoxin HicB